MPKKSDSSFDIEKLRSELFWTGLTPANMAHRLKKALNKSLKAGKSMRLYNRRLGRELMVPGPDFVSYQRLMELWARWMGVEIPNGSSKSEGGLSADELKAVEGLIDQVEGEGGEKGVDEEKGPSGILPGESGSKDSASLPRVVESGAVEEEDTH